MSAGQVLMWAVEAGSTALVQKLLEVGADANYGEGRYMSSTAGEAEATPLHEATRRGYPAIVELLLAHGARADSVICVYGDSNALDGSGNNSGITALHLAAGGGQCEIVRSLLEHGADPNAQDRYGNTSLHKAVAPDGHLAVARLLLASGADAARPNLAGLTPLDMAERDGHREVAASLRGDWKR